MLSRSLMLTCIVLAIGASPAMAGGTAGGASYVDREGAGALPQPSDVPRGFDFVELSPTAEPGRLPDVRFRVSLPGIDRVGVRLVVTMPGSTEPYAAVRLGDRETGVLHTGRWPEDAVLEPGRYVVRLRATAAGDGRSAPPVRVSAKRAITVAAATSPGLAATSPGAAGSLGIQSGVFPVAGAYEWGGDDARFGAPRGDHVHEGQDLPAAVGTPVVAPTAGSVSAVGFQPDGAGYYVTMRSVDGRDFFFAHLLKGSTAVAVGRAVSVGTVLAGVGSSGASFGAHLHFEMWEGGWQRGRPVDPLPQLRAWIE